MSINRSVDRVCLNDVHSNIRIHIHIHTNTQIYSHIHACANTYTRTYAYQYIVKARAGVPQCAFLCGQRENVRSLVIVGGHVSNFNVLGSNACEHIGWRVGSANMHVGEPDTAIPLGVVSRIDVVAVCHAIGPDRQSRAPARQPGHLGPPGYRIPVVVQGGFRSVWMAIRRVVPRPPSAKPERACECAGRRRCESACALRGARVLRQVSTRPFGVAVARAACRGDGDTAAAGRYKRQRLQRDPAARTSHPPRRRQVRVLNASSAVSVLPSSCAQVRPSMSSGLGELAHTSQAVHEE